MAHKSLEQRVATLEKRLDHLQKQSNTTNEDGGWRSTIGMFSGDDGMMEIFQEAMRLREADRAAARRKQIKRRKSK
jgi:hypothetical protein